MKSTRAMVVRSMAAASVMLFLALPDLAHAINCRMRVFPISFGTYIPLQTTDNDVTGTIRSRCRGSAGTFEITIGAGASGNQLARTLLANVSDTLGYQLYRDAARTQIWGDGIPPTFTDTGFRPPGGGGPSVNFHNIYARIPANQAPESGSYGDSLVVTILF